jgi:hypothetical protein
MDMIKNMLLMEDLEVFDFFSTEAVRLQREVVRQGNEFLVVRGNNPRLWFVAHIDTVCSHRGPRKSLLIRRGIITAYVEGDDGVKHKTVLGADDRAGCYALYKLMLASNEANLLLTNYEECGGQGASAFAAARDVWEGAKIFIEFDRKDCNTYVQYNENPKEMHDWLRRFNIKNDGYGSYSDIATISKATRIPSCNLGIGYYNQHSSREFLDVAAMNMAIEKAKNMITDFGKCNRDFGLIGIKSATEKAQRKWSNAITGVSGDWPLDNARVDSELLGWTMDNETREVKCDVCGNRQEDGHARICTHYSEPDGQQGLFAFGNQ